MEAFKESSRRVSWEKNTKEAAPAIDERDADILTLLTRRLGRGDITALEYRIAVRAMVAEGLE